jgi:hypothetical protein
VKQPRCTDPPTSAMVSTPSYWKNIIANHQQKKNDLQKQCVLKFQNYCGKKNII